tara:strand:+ start:820 stop:1977 length:1158 start_codon:yes stop_codon:yes gene_type:complete
MPGYELIDNKEFLEISDIFKKSKTLFRMGFEKQRKGIFKVNKFEEKFTFKLKSNYGLAVSSGTAALRVALSTLNLKEGDEVITQSFTFVATVEAIVESRAVPVCTEVDETLNMDPDDLVKKISKKTKAVIVVHMLGVPARLDKIKKICKKYNLVLIEDTAWGCGAKYKNKFLGTWGDMGAFSFDFAKTITTGEGGMVLFKSKKKFEAAKAWHDHGHENNPKVPRWEDTRKSSGFNFRMTEMQAAVGLAQLKKLDFIVKKQRENHDKIWNKIKDIPGITKRLYPSHSKISADALIFFVKNRKEAIKCRESLIKEGISTKILPEAYTWHFAKEWTHIKNLRKKHRNLKKSFNRSETLIKKSVSLPIFVKTSNKKIIKIEKALKKVLK